MNAPHDLGPDFRSWLRDVAPMPHELPERTLGQTRHTRQRRRWLWFRPGRKPTAGADDQGIHGPPMAPFTTTPTGGITTMFSPTNLVTAAAVAALAGVLLLAGPFTTQEVDRPVVPAAVSDQSSITYVDGQVSAEDPADSGGVTAKHDWGYSVTDILWTGEFQTSDERLNGQARFRLNTFFGQSDHDFGSHAVSVFLENEGGSWQGTGRGYRDALATEGEPAAGSHTRLVLEGQGGYEGLSAIVSLDQPDSYSPFELTGAITSVPLPPIPESAPTTFE